MASVPFLFDLKNKDDIVVSFTPEDNLISGSKPLARLVDWNLTDADSESSISMICCRFELNSDRLFELDQLPILDVNVSIKDGIQKHLHSTILEIGELCY